MPLRVRFYVGVALVLVLVTAGIVFLQGQRDRELDAFLAERLAFDQSWHADRLITEPLRDDRDKPVRTHLRLQLPIASKPSDEEIRQKIYHPFPFKRRASFTLRDSFYVPRRGEPNFENESGSENDLKIAVRMMDIFTEFIPPSYITHSVAAAPQLIDSDLRDIVDEKLPPRVATVFISPSGHSAIWIAIESVVRGDQRKLVARGSYSLSFPNKLDRDDLIEECKALTHSRQSSEAASKSHPESAR